MLTTIQVPDVVGYYRKAQSRQLDAFPWPVGTKVVVNRVSGQQLDTRTRSLAYALADGTAVVQVDNIMGSVALDRVRVR